MLLMLICFLLYVQLFHLLSSLTANPRNDEE